ncbi:MAG: hypothetical protein WED33_13500 [Bacteroidia bacterium]
MIEYSETIYVRKTWIMALVLTSVLISLLIVGIIILGTSTTEESFSAVTILVIVEGLLLFFLLSSYLSLKVNKAGIYYKWFPFHFNDRFIQWEEVAKVYVRKYNAMSEYGGWGIKGRKSNRAFNVSGNMGLQLELLSGRKVLIETQRPEELEKVIKNYARERKLNL